MPQKGLYEFSSQRNVWETLVWPVVRSASKENNLLEVPVGLHFENLTTTAVRESLVNA